MSYRLPLWATAAVAAAAVLITFNLTYTFAERKFQEKLDTLTSGLSDTADESQTSELPATSAPAELSAEGIGMYITLTDGVYSVDGLIENGVAALSGIVVGDVISAIDGAAADSSSLEALAGGETLIVIRGEEEFTVELSAVSEIQPDDLP